MSYLFTSPRRQVFSWHGSFNLDRPGDSLRYQMHETPTDKAKMDSEVMKHFLKFFFSLNRDLAWDKWTASSEFGTYHLCEQRRFRRVCASAQSRQNLRCSLIQVMTLGTFRQKARSLAPLNGWTCAIKISHFWKARRHKFAWRGSNKGLIEDWQSQSTEMTLQGVRVVWRCYVTSF